jgi:hypothetical protein
MHSHTRNVMGVWSQLHGPSALSPERIPGTHWVRAGLDAEASWKFFTPAEKRAPAVQLVARSATPALNTRGMCRPIGQSAVRILPLTQHLVGVPEVLYLYMNINKQATIFQVLTAASMKMSVFWNVTLCRLKCLHHQGIVLTMEATSISEMSVNFYQTRRRNIPEDSHIH